MKAPMAAPIEIDVWQGEIAELEVDAIVVAANESLFMNAGAASSVMRHGGAEIERAAVAQGPIEPGSAVVTGAGTLAAAYVIHTVAVGHDRVADPERLTAAIRAALAFAAPLQLRRIAVAPLGVEHGAFDPADAARILVTTLSEAATPPLESIVVATAGARETSAVSEAIATHRAGIR
jgi:O-acetyl-ADP-ribose deacetylase (regulator of RNase III)